MATASRMRTIAEPEAIRYRLTPDPSNQRLHQRPSQPLRQPQHIHFIDRIVVAVAVKIDALAFAERFAAEPLAGDGVVVTVTVISHYHPQTL